MEGAIVRPMMNLAAPAIRRTLTALNRCFDRADQWSARPFDEPDIMVPNVESRKYGWTHFGVMIPDLPEPTASSPPCRSSEPPDRWPSTTTTRWLISAA